MILRLAEKKDALEIANIHKTEISQGFLSSLDLKFLEKIYVSVINSDYGFCVLAEEENNIIGFVAGAINIKKIYFYFTKKYFFQFIKMILPKILNFAFIKKIFETLLYPQKESNLPEAELLTIAVKNEFQGKGVAGKMIQMFIQEAKNRSIKEFKVLVGEDLAGAIKFYEKNGFKFVKEVIVHNNKKSRIYIYDLSN